MIRILHDQFTQLGGAEKVALNLTKILHSNQIFTSISRTPVLIPDERSIQIIDYWHNPSKLQCSLPQLFPKQYQESFLRVGEIYKDDRMVASSTGWSHLAALRNQNLTVYCHGPNRVMYFPEELKSSFVALYSKSIYRKYRQRDQEAMYAANLILTNSLRSSNRISLVYGLKAKVVYPPAKIFTTHQTPVPNLPNKFILIVGRNRRYKNHEILIQVSHKLRNVNFVFVGGSDNGRKDGIYRIGKVTESELLWLYKNCQFVISIGEEDLGLVPAEAASLGKPSLGLRGFGASEVIVDGKSGLFCDLTVDSIIDGIERMSTYHFSNSDIVESSYKFSVENFAINLKRELNLC